MEANLIYQLLSSDLFTMTNIQRYSGANIIKNENLAEHSYYVCVLSDLIAEDIEKRYPNRQIDRSKVLRYAIYHDYEEIYTGDIVTPVKYKSLEFKEKLEELGALLIKEGLTSNFSGNEHIGSRIGDSNKEYESKKDKDLENRVVKFADVLQSLTYVIREYNMGNSYMEVKLKNIVKVIIQKYSNSHYFRPYVANLLEVIDAGKIVRTNIIDIDWDAFKSMVMLEE